MSVSSNISTRFAEILPSFVSAAGITFDERAEIESNFSKFRGKSFGKSDCYYLANRLEKVLSERWGGGVPSELEKSVQNGPKDLEPSELARELESTVDDLVNKFGKRIDWKAEGNKELKKDLSGLIDAFCIEKFGSGVSGSDYNSAISGADSAEPSEVSRGNTGTSQYKSDGSDSAQPSESVCPSQYTSSPSRRSSDYVPSDANST